MIKKLLILLGFISILATTYALGQNLYNTNNPEMIGWNIYDVSTEVVSRGLLLNYDTGSLNSDKATAYIMGCDNEGHYCHLFYFKQNECNLIIIIPGSYIAYLTMKDMVQKYWIYWGEDIWTREFENGWRTVEIINQPGSDLPLFMIE